MKTGTRILVAEDEPDMLRGLEHALANEGYKVEPAKDGAEAAGKLEAERFDVVVSDLRMPAIDGMDLLRMAKEKDKDVVFIMITAYGTPDNAVQAMKLGSFDYVPKPFTASALKAAIERGLDARMTGAPARVEAVIDRTDICRHPTEHAWSCAQPDGTVVVGADQEFLAEAGEIVFCDLPLQGDRVVKGERCARTIDSTGLVQKPFLCPLNGTVVGVNEKMVHEPWEARLHPYSEGWLFKIAPALREEKATA